MKVLLANKVKEYCTWTTQLPPLSSANLVPVFWLSTVKMAAAQTHSIPGQQHLTNFTCAICS